MNANELMIGDWVRIKEPSKYEGCIGTIKTLLNHKEDEGAYFKVFLREGVAIGLEDIYNEDIEPIPLTAEILEKNGFKYRKLDGGDYYYITDDYFDITIDEWSDSIWRFRYYCTEMNMPPTQVLLCNVHELQQALRLSGLSEIADNFKV